MNLVKKLLKIVNSKDFEKYFYPSSDETSIAWFKSKMMNIIKQLQQ